MTGAKNYYQILEIDNTASAEEIKRGYRRLAFAYHPDRNQGRADATEMFQTISEAYAVLSNPLKRREYDQKIKNAAKAGPGASPRPEHATQASREDLFREMFKNASQAEFFQDLGEQMRRSGARFDDRFMNKMFFGGRRFFFFSSPPRRRGMSGRGPGRGRHARRERPGRPTAFPQDSTWARPLGARLKTELGRGARLARAGLSRLAAWTGLAREKLNLAWANLQRNSLDIHFNLTITPRQSREGGRLEVAYKKNGQPQRVWVRVPQATAPGSRLRLRGLGHLNHASGETGDLYLHIRVGHS